MKIVFMGTPEIAVPTLDALHADGHEIAAVFTQPDRPAGRGKKLRASAVKQRAEALGLPVYQPESLRRGDDAAEAMRVLQEIAPELIVVIAYGQILPKEILCLPQHGCINLHASLLPRWRGAAPIQRVILAGDTETGVTAMQMAQEALQESSPATPGSARGTMGDYRYLVTSVSGTRLAVFLNVHDELASQRSFLRASALTGVVGVLAFACLIVPFSFAVSAPVERAQRAQRRFVTDASHELRTPIAIISSATDVVEIDAGESEWTRSIHNQTRRLARLTDRLVMLSRADEGADALRLADVDLSALVREMAGDFEAVAYSRGKHVETHVADDVTCRVDEAMTRQVVSTLLDNALKYSADASTVAVSLAPARHGMATLTVTNAVVRIEPGAHPELFERFYRADASRSSGSGGTCAGHGIGLAIVRAVAEAHGGDATARSDDGRSLTITVTL